MKLIGEIIPPIRRFWPDAADRKRQVEIVVRLHEGYGTHFYVEVTEEHNYVYDETAGEWIAPEDDERGAGMRRAMRFATPRHARRWIDAIFTENAIDERYEIAVRGDVSETWLFPERAG